MRIGVIDDDDFYRLYVKQQVKKIKNTEAMLFEDGKKAADYFETHSDTPERLPDVIILDLHMPEMDGWGFLDFYRTLKIKKDIKIYVVTSSKEAGDADKALKNDLVYSYLLKPLTPDTVVKICHTYHGSLA